MDVEKLIIHKTRMLPKSIQQSQTQPLQQMAVIWAILELSLLQWMSQQSIKLMLHKQISWFTKWMHWRLLS
ncbi:hypothetical protein A9Y76_11565 [Ralstonia insidiosa]|uniref:Uncharacterized protein n=1 Tax=Ralstonia insidiosa TaxID=190721 RepID=A0A191ZYC0_9RALS|nr:hypothetical protein A9Y76_11565 [Ralstonia insidiosa]